jgi:two-component system, OmpR family, phosphate regulon sensor histidine kinase PhoR
VVVRSAPRAWIYVLSAAALLVPAGGIAYLGAVSYGDDRGAVTAQAERHRQAALAIGAQIERGIEDALDEVDRKATMLAEHGQGGGEIPASAPLARHWFWIDGDGKLVYPRMAPPTVELPGALERGVGCAGDRLEDCERELRTRTKREAQLRAALRAEASQSWTEARKLYLGAAAEDTEPEALLGLARVYARMGERARADQALGELERKYADRTFKGIPVRLVVATLGAEASGPDALLDVAEAVLAGRYGLDPVVRLGVLARIRHKLERVHSPDQLQRRAALDERVGAIRSEARAAAGLVDEVAEVVRTATPAWRGRPAARDPARTLVFRRRGDAGGFVGIAVDAPMLERVVATADDRVAPNARPLVLAAGALPGPQLRTIVQVPLGTALPHLSLAVVNPLSDPDPLDEVIRERSRRHVIYTSALAVLLGLGLLATIRSTARARELAQLKSDFVSTVSHELKTPLTSIRMFAEMLEQGVAQGDHAKMARYHGVIVQESQRLGLLIANLLDYAQIERGTRRYAPTRQAIDQLARHAVQTFETLRDPERGGSNPIDVVVSPEAMAAEVETDRDVVVQAVLNLISNAAKYGGAAQRIEVLVGVDAQTAWIGVRDHGPGIPASEHARIFREFYRTAEAYRSGIEGTGLGLALVKRHIEALGGTVGLDSVVGKGSTFTIRLPRLGGGREEPVA